MPLPDLCSVAESVVVGRVAAEGVRHGSGPAASDRNLLSEDVGVQLVVLGLVGYELGVGEHGIHRRVAEHRPLQQPCAGIDASRGVIGEALTHDVVAEGDDAEGGHLCIPCLALCIVPAPGPASARVGHTVGLKEPQPTMYRRNPVLLGTRLQPGDVIGLERVVVI